MPRITQGEGALDLWYLSPSDMVDHLSDTPETGEFPLPDGLDAIPEGDQRVTIHVPWLGRRIAVMASASRNPDDPEKWILRVLRRPDSHVEDLFEILARLRGGNLIEEHAGETQAQRIQAMGPTLRGMLALKADQLQRGVLMQDPDPKVIMFLLKNPGITLEEVRRLAARPSLSPRHLEFIGTNRNWMRDTALRLALGRHPRLPQHLASAILPSLTTKDLREIALRPETIAATRRAAAKILKQRGFPISDRLIMNG